MLVLINFDGIIQSSAVVLVFNFARQCSNPVKVRWNSCIKSFLGNPSVKDF